MAKAPKTDAAWAVEVIRTALHDAGHTLESAEVLYKKVFPWGTDRTRIFLVRYTRGDGYSSVGCAGPFVRLLDLPSAAIEALPAKTANRRLLELYIGQFFIDRARALADRPTMPDAADLQAAFGRHEGDLGLSRQRVTTGADNLKSTYSTSLPARFCTLRVHGPLDGIWLEGVWHLIADVTIVFDISRGGTSTQYEGSVEVRGPYYFRSEDGQTIAYPYAVGDDSVSFPAHRLANVIGVLYGPGEILDKWGWAHFKD